MFNVVEVFEATGVTEVSHLSAREFRDWLLYMKPAVRLHDFKEMYKVYTFFVCDAYVEVERVG